MSYEIEWRPGAIEDITALFEYLVENASLWDARNVTERLITATDRLADYPRLYETDERYGEGVRRIRGLKPNGAETYAKKLTI
ncbi:TPA: type II toxin-antitoxin system RelE/ParE family toxin [Escherichia coli]|nr:type II toxin-antitoxin system RelE/ParE family toxin [Escherichia coli]